MRKLCVAAIFVALLVVSVSVRAARQTQPTNSVLVTVYFGSQSKPTIEKWIEIRPNATVIEAMKNAAVVQINRDARIVTAIEGVENAKNWSEYWVLFVNGEWMSEGAADFRLKPGDRVLWLYRKAGS
jgi:hypothetical protein